MAASTGARERSGLNRAGPRSRPRPTSPAAPRAAPLQRPAAGASAQQRIPPAATTSTGPASAADRSSASPSAPPKGTAERRARSWPACRRPSLERGAASRAPRPGRRSRRPPSPLILRQTTVAPPTQRNHLPVRITAPANRIYVVRHFRTQPAMVARTIPHHDRRPPAPTRAPQIGTHRRPAALTRPMPRAPLTVLRHPAAPRP